MNAPVWQTTAGFLGTFTERTVVSITLNTVDPSLFSLISGYLPTGLNLSSNGIISGIPASVGETVATQFVVRASDIADSTLITDRTFTIDIQGASNLSWVTPTGYLNVGFGREYYAINKEHVDFQFVANPGQLYATLSTATDVQVNTLYLSTLTNVDTGQPGIWRTVGGYGIQNGTTITNISYNFNPVFNGYAVGISLPTIAALTATSTIILYDSLPSNRKINYYILDKDGDLPPGLTLDTSGKLSGYVEDNLGLNYQVSTTGGYDSEKFDGYPYDHSNIVNGQNRQQTTFYIPKIYQFYVTADDGVEQVKQKFLIKVVDPSNLTSDINSSDASGPLAAESSNLVPPVWTTPIDLGTIRTSNQEIVQLKNYDPYPNVGPKIYTATATNRWMPETSYNTGEWVVYYPGNYLFNGQWDALSNSPVLSNNSVMLPNTQYIVSSNGNQDLGNGMKSYSIGDLIIYNGSSWDVISVHDTSYICTEAHMSSNSFDRTKWIKNQLPQYFELDPLSGVLYATIPYLPIFVKTYTFTVRIEKQDILKDKIVFANRTFNLTIRGSVDNVISFVTPSNLGDLNIGYLSELSIVAEHTSYPVSIHYSVASGQLPPGLILGTDGSIVGRIEHGTVIGQYNFTVSATDIYQQVIEQDFYINVTKYDDNKYTQIYITPFMDLDSRNLYDIFINDSNIFDRNLIYRPSDTNFGVQIKPKIYLEYGIQQAYIDDYFYATHEFFYKKNLIFGNLQLKQAIDKNGTYLYDVIYVEILDNKLDTQGLSVDIKGVQAYPNSILNMKAKLESMLINQNLPVNIDEYQMPLWMRTYQQDTEYVLGYVPSLVLCYTLPGLGKKILNKIQNYNIDFSKFNFEIDRLIVQSTLSNTNPAYVIFPNQGSSFDFNNYYLYLNSVEFLLDLTNSPLTLQ
jgi:Putative Ig domain